MDSPAGVGMSDEPKQEAKTNISGDAIGPVLSGTFHGSVNLGAAIPTALDSIPTPIGTFRGRDTEVAKLVTALVSRDRTATILGIRGLGGIGKSQLAFSVAQQAAAHFPDGRLYIPVGAYTPSPLSAALALQRAMHAFYPQAQLPEDVQELASLYRSTLSGKRMLVLADDADDIGLVKLLIPPPPSVLLVTSRHRFNIPGGQSLDLGVLPSEEAALLLLRLCPRIGKYAPLLASYCGYLPLALQISAGLLATNDTWDVAMYIKRFDQESLKLLSDPDEGGASVSSSLGLSYQALPAEAQQVLVKLSIFLDDFDMAEVFAAIGKKDVTDTLDLLRRRSLIEWDEERKTYRLHDLVRAFASEHLSAADQKRARAAVRLIQIGDASFESGDNEAAANAFEEAISLQPDDATLRYRAGLVQHRLKHYRRAIEHYRRAIKLQPDYGDAIMELSKLGPLAFFASETGW